MIDFKQFGVRMRYARRKKGMTQEKLAEILDISVEHLSRVESGSFRPSIVLIERISEALSVPEQTLLFGISDAGNDLQLLEKIQMLPLEKRFALSQMIDWLL